MITLNSIGCCLLMLALNQERCDTVHELALTIERQAQALLANGT
jgi:hypothetical protein